MVFDLYKETVSVDSKPSNLSLGSLRVLATKREHTKLGDPGEFERDNTKDWERLRKNIKGRYSSHPWA